MIGNVLTLEALPMTLVSGAVLCFALGYLQQPVCNAMGTYESECKSFLSYSTTMASFSAVGALILFSLVSMGVMSMPRGGYMGMGGMGGYF